MGICYLNGIGCRKNPHLAFRLFENANNLGDIYCSLYLNSITCMNLAKCNLGYCYQFGIGCEMDLQKALNLYEEGSDSGDPLGKKN